jgi:hypothetical protein
MADGQDELQRAALRALQDDSGCTPERAKALLTAVDTAAAAEAREVIAGRALAVGSALDRRVSMLDRVIGAMNANEALPTAYEVGVIFRITPTQARNVLRTYQARFSEAYRGRLQGALSTVTAKRQQRGDASVFVFDFDDPEVLDYASDRLRRRGLTRSVSVDRTRLQIVVDRSETDRFNKTADAALKVDDLDRGKG